MPLVRVYLPRALEEPRAKVRAPPCDTSSNPLSPRSPSGAVGVGAEPLAARFVREATLAAGLRYRHAVDVLDFGVMENGAPQMVKELLAAVARRRDR